MGTLQRIKIFIDNKGITIKAFEESVGFSNGAFGSQLRNNKTIGVDKIENILSVYPELSPEWLLTGKGTMLKTEKVYANAIPASFVNDKMSEYSGLKQIPLVSQLVAAGFGSEDFQIKEQDVKDFYVVPKFRNKRVDFMIEVTGSSMYPKYNSGDVIACTIIKESGFIQWNKAHVIATREQGILVKRLKEGSDQDHLIAISDNKDYPPFEISKEEITGIAIVAGVIRLE